MPAANAHTSSRTAIAAGVTTDDSDIVARKKPRIGASASVNSDVTAAAASDTASVCAHDNPAPR